MASCGRAKLEGQAKVAAARARLGERDQPQRAIKLRLSEAGAVASHKVPDLRPTLCRSGRGMQASLQLHCTKLLDRLHVSE